MFSFKKFLLLFCLTLFLFLLIQFLIKNKNQKHAPLEVSFLNVGQGDAILINFENQKQILIDSGISNKVILTELSKVMPMGDKKIETVIATHYDKDHIGGMRAVFENYEIGLFLDNGQFSDTEATTVVSDLIKSQKIDHHSIEENSKIEIGELILIFLNPDGEEQDANNNSVVARLDYGINSFLFVGDAEQETERDMISDGHNLDVDWLKVGHHGSKSSSTEEFLKKVTPEKAVISVGENSYGHPDEGVLDRLKSFGAEVLMTLNRGTIRVDCWREKKCVVVE